MRRTLATALTLGLLALLTGSHAAHAQGAIVSGSVSAASANDDTSPAFGGAITWRTNRVLGFGVELSHIRGLGHDEARIACCGTDITTRTTVFTTNVRLEIPTISPRVIPFVIAGGGMAAGTTRYPVMYAQLEAASRIGANTVPIMPGPGWVDSSGSSMALTLGGGASFLITPHVSVDVDLRVLHTKGDNGNGNLGRFGGGVSYRF